MKAAEAGSRFAYRVYEHLARLALSKDRDRARAIEYLEKAKQISPLAGAGYAPRQPPKRPNVYYRLVELYNKEGQEDQAIEQFEQLRTFAVEDAYCRMALVKHYLTQENEAADKLAFEILGEMIYIQPFDRKIHEELARVATRLDAHEIVIREYGYLLEFPDTNPRVAYLALARAHLGLGKKEDAKKYAQKVLLIDGDNAEARAILETLKKD